MKTIIKRAVLAFVVAGTMMACKKQNIPEAELVARLTEKKSDAYYEQLRAYKKSKHQIYFGWFGGTGEAGSPDKVHVIQTIPDSVDIVSLWGGYPPLGSYGQQVMQEARRLKGTKFVWCKFGSGVEKLVYENFPDLAEKDLMAAIDSTAKSMADTIAKYQIDGFDLDYEPNYGDPSIFGDEGFLGGATDDPHTQRLFKALSQYLGPKSGTDKLLIIDGQFDVGIEPYVNYLMQQAYGSSETFTLQWRFDNFGAGVLPSEKFVPCDDFEKYWSTGGSVFTDPKIGETNALSGFAYWNPKQGPKGGIGTFHTEYEYQHNPEYKYTRKAIQLMNPAKHK